jgi:hypothetical protein
MAAQAFGATPDSRRWLPNGPYADINNDDRVDMIDLVTVAKNFGNSVGS